MNYFLNRAKELEQELIAMRRELHSYAELGFDLPKTNAFVTEKLRSYGYEPKTVGKAGVTCTVGKGGKVLLLRADMDALPMPEESGMPYAAQNGHCHSCGHDCHTAMLLIAAKMLKEKEGELKGTVKFMFQPAEELLAGAAAMVEDGILENPKVDVALGLHISVGMDDTRSGIIRYIPGVANNSGDAIRISIQGHGVHGSKAYLGVDAINIAAHTIIALQEILALEIPQYPAGCGAGRQNGGRFQLQQCGRYRFPGDLGPYQFGGDPQLSEKTNQRDCRIGGIYLPRNCHCGAYVRYAASGQWPGFRTGNGPLRSRNAPPRRCRGDWAQWRWGGLCCGGREGPRSHDLLGCRQYRRRLLPSRPRSQDEGQ